MKHWVLKLLIVLAALGLLTVGALKVKEWIDIDRCLDSGGSWNYSKKQCEH
jgi:hypothetical protein